MCKQMEYACLATMLWIRDQQDLFSELQPQHPACCMDFFWIPRTTGCRVAYHGIHVVYICGGWLGSVSREPDFCSVLSIPHFSPCRFRILLLLQSLSCFNDLLSKFKPPPSF